MLSTKKETVKSVMSAYKSLSPEDQKEVYSRIKTLNYVESDTYCNFYFKVDGDECDYRQITRDIYVKKPDDLSDADFEKWVDDVATKLASDKHTELIQYEDCTTGDLSYSYEMAYENDTPHKTTWIEKYDDINEFIKEYL